MRDITNREFCELFIGCGEPDLYISEFLRVHPTSGVDKNIEDLLSKRTSSNPLFIQLLGHDPQSFVRIANQLKYMGADGIDLNFGCPMPKIYKKWVGGMLLNDPSTIERIVAFLKERIALPISAKIRIGFADDSNFEQILRILDRYDLFSVTIHARTVRGLYREPVKHEYIKRAKQVLRCPVFANGEIHSANQAVNVLESTRCDGVMIGRAAIRNPYIFSQIHSLLNQKSPKILTFYDIGHYINQLLEISAKLSHTEHSQIGLMKKYLNFVGQSVDENGEFLYHMRRTSTKNELMQVIDRYIFKRGTDIFPDEPYPHLMARPNHE